MTIRNTTNDLPIACPKCRGAVMMRLTVAAEADPLSTISWSCPYCHAQSHFSSRGRYVDVRTRTANQRS